MRRFLRSLLPTWHTKATVIEKSKDSSTLSLEELIGSLMTYEINVHKNEDDSKKKKTIAFNASKISQSSSDEVDSDEQDEVAMITRQVRKFLQKKKKDLKETSKKPKGITHTNVSQVKKETSFAINVKNRAT